MDTSVCFDSRTIEALNEKAQKVDPRLYLFAYYEPKEFSQNDDPRFSFWKAIVNLYGLFWDCGPFVHKSLLICSANEPLLNILPDVSWDVKKEIVYRCRNLTRVISSFRSILCHNNSQELALNKENFDVANNWLSHCGIVRCYEELTNEDWQQMLIQLNKEATQIVQDIDYCLDSLISCRGSVRFKVACETWMLAIARYYLTNPDLLLNAMSELYLMFLDNSKIRRNYNASLRVLTMNWLVSNFHVDRNNWYKQWLGDQNNVENSRVYKLITGWQSYWEKRNLICEPVMPASSFFLVLANDVYQFAQNPSRAFFLQ